MGVSQKEGHNGMKTNMKAGLVVWGFQEDDEPRADLPALAKEPLKVMMAIAAN